MIDFWWNPQSYPHVTVSLTSAHMAIEFIHVVLLLKRMDINIFQLKQIATYNYYNEVDWRQIHHSLSVNKATSRNKRMPTKSSQLMQGVVNNKSLYHENIAYSRHFPYHENPKSPPPLNNW